MKELDLVIHNPSGLHARPAKVFVNTAKQFKSDIRLQHGAKKANAKSMISILTLGVESGGQIRLIVNGPDEDEAVAVLQTAIEEGLGDEVQAELSGPQIEVGIMIEIPAAAVLADIFAKDVDFFSIGTNDPTQYTLAMDRGHPELSAQADGLHPAVLRLIDQTVQAAHAAGKWVGVCGELGADPQAVPIPAVKAQIRSLSLSTAKRLAAEALERASATEVRRTVDSLSLRTFSKTKGDGG